MPLPHLAKDQNQGTEIYSKAQVVASCTLQERARLTDMSNSGGLRLL